MGLYLNGKLVGISLPQQIQRLLQVIRFGLKRKQVQAQEILAHITHKILH